MSVLILADHHDGQLAGTTAHVVAAAQQIVKDSGGDIDLLVAGQEVQSVAEQAAKLDGVNRVRIVDHAVYAHQLAEPLADLLVRLADDYSHVLASSSTTGKN
ncbi:MAG: electron transfer flavoprotein subunit alpha/FixB family protein, partial [Pseudomonadota bacterium]|nr:electron transfer flavoprotein subunit alpha/FixB family protein [Pseudomonadota bacterium]